MDVIVMLRLCVQWGCLPAMDSAINAANGNTIAAYWKNGTLTKLTDGSQNAYAEMIAMRGLDVFIAGISNKNALYWKNGTANHIADNANGSAANSVLLDGDDVYFTGTVNTPDGMAKAAYWKNGALNKLSTESSLASAMAINGTLVCVAGVNVSGQGVLLKDGIQSLLGENFYPYAAAVLAK